MWCFDGVSDVLIGYKVLSIVERTKPSFKSEVYRGFCGVDWDSL